ncbi:HTH domain-containing protein [Halorubrum sp. BOL3-1]|uniref:HTH domain-containing protein n=1 Tax=Halorubrum sp. BOL3-1 TaxID=2497325 RepID=UPI001004E679|nr:HTH domain-containing protein [Halorubrum sp. BOL3-1]QAU14067.1 HTH domain-containing protein [Halorubrum sp. BOL3-1]
MSLPPWVSEQLPEDRRVNTKLTQQHVIETMYQSDRPFFSVQQIQQRLNPDVSKVTVRNRLDDLDERGIIATETLADSLTLYYINHPESEWPLSPEGKQALNRESAETRNPLREFFRHPRVHLIFREELLRSIAWAGLGLFGWAILITSSGQLPATVWTVVGLPILTWVSLTVGMIGIRLITGNDLQVQSREGLHLISISGAVLAGFWAVFLILVLDWAPLLTSGLYLSATITYFVVYKRVIFPRFDAPIEN